MTQDKGNISVAGHGLVGKDVPLSFFEFRFMDDSTGIEWAGKRHKGGNVWLYRFNHNQDNWISVRELSENEVWEYKDLAGLNPRSGGK